MQSVDHHHSNRRIKSRIDRLLHHIYPHDHHHGNFRHLLSNDGRGHDDMDKRELSSSSSCRENRWGDLFSLVLFTLERIVIAKGDGKALHASASASSSSVVVVEEDEEETMKDVDDARILTMQCTVGLNQSDKQDDEQIVDKQQQQDGRLYRPSLLNKIIRSFQGSGPLSTDSIQAFNNILFLVNSIPPSLNSLGIFNIMLRSAKPDSDLLPFLAQVKIPKSALGGADYKTFISTLSQVQMYLPAWYYNSLVLAKALNNFDSILLYCAQRFSREIKVRKAVISALIYPAIMTTMGLAGLALLLTRILPQNIQIFESMGLTVPRFLQVTNYLVRNVQYHWLALLYIIPASLSSQYLPFRTYLKWEYMKLHTPIGHLRFLQDKATLLHMLSLLDKEQIASKLLLVCSNIGGNVVLQHMVESMAAMAKYGASSEEILSFLLTQKHVFTPYEIAYLQACFLGGKHSIVQDGLRYVSQMVLQEYTASLQTVLKVLGPATIAMVGVLVVIVALIGIYPQIELSSTVSAR